MSTKQPQQPSIVQYAVHNPSITSPARSPGPWTLVELTKDRYVCHNCGWTQPKRKWACPICGYVKSIGRKTERVRMKDMYRSQLEYLLHKDMDSKRTITGTHFTHLTPSIMPEYL